ncbi:hypothetical protein EDB89DRAFT_185690 [Lactarius sanguifluus]|nr:hypothetical protein EDB89DRAFT_185690 [Lactarius sanguifluus]
MMGTARAGQISYSLHGQPQLVLRRFSRHEHRPSKIWVSCPGPRFRPLSSFQNSPLFGEVVRALENSRETSDLLAPRDKPGDGGAGTQSLPAWLHNVFREEMGGSLRALRPLIGPSDIRAKYVSALQKHVTTDRCAFCPGCMLWKGRNISRSWNVH